MALMSLVLRVDTSWLKSGWESLESCRKREGWGVAERGSGIVLMPSLSASDCDCDWAVLARCGVELERVTWFLGMGDRERRREGVMEPVLCTQGAECAMKLWGRRSALAWSGSGRSRGGDWRWIVVLE